MKNKVTDDRLNEFLEGEYPEPDELKAMIDEIQHWRWLDDVSNNLADSEEIAQGVLQAEEALRHLRYYLYMSQHHRYGTPPAGKLQHNPYFLENQDRGRARASEEERLK